MARKLYKKSAKNARSHKKFKRTMAKRYSLSRRVTPFLPNKRVTKHVYADEYSYSLTAATSVIRRYSGNGMYDPDITGTGHQPFGFDEMANLYKYYTVKASAIAVFICPGAAGTNLISAVAPDATAATTPTISTVGDMWEKFGSGNVRINSNTDGANSLVRHKRYVATRKVTTVKLGDDTLIGTAGANPTNQWVWNVAMLNNGSTTSTGKMYVRITYYCQWAEPNDFNAS